MTQLFRDTLLWVKAVDLMRRLKPDTLVPQHTRPLEGSEVIMETLTAYRDAIQVSMPINKYHPFSIAYFVFEAKRAFINDVTQRGKEVPYVHDVLC